MSLEFIVDNKKIEIFSFNKNFDKSGRGWGSIFKIIGNDSLSEIGLAKEFYFKCDIDNEGTFKFELEDGDESQKLNPPENFNQLSLFHLLRNAVKTGKAYF